MNIFKSEPILLKSATLMNKIFNTRTVRKVSLSRYYKLGRINLYILSLFIVLKIVIETSVVKIVGGIFSVVGIALSAYKTITGNQLFLIILDIKSQVVNTFSLLNSYL